MRYGSPAAPVAALRRHAATSDDDDVVGRFARQSSRRTLNDRRHRRATRPTMTTIDTHSAFTVVARYTNIQVSQREMNARKSRRSRARFSPHDTSQHNSFHMGAVRRSYVPGNSGAHPGFFRLFLVNEDRLVVSFLVAV